MSKVILIIAIITLLFCLIVGVSIAKEIDAKDVNWNVSSSLTQKNDAKILIYYDGDYSFRIVDSNDNELVKMKEGFTKGEDGIYKHEWSSHGSSSSFDTGMGTSSVAYGEYVKINDNTYWVESSITKTSSGTYDKVENDISNIDTDKLIEYIKYFNEHNKVEIVDL